MSTKINNKYNMNNKDINDKKNNKRKLDTYSNKVDSKKQCIDTAEPVEDEKKELKSYLKGVHSCELLNLGGGDETAQYKLKEKWMKTLIKTCENVSEKSEKKEVTAVTEEKNNIFFHDSETIAKSGIKENLQNFDHCCKNLKDIFKEIRITKINVAKEETHDLKRSGLLTFTNFKKFYEISRLFVQGHKEKTIKLKELCQVKYVALDTLLYEMDSVIGEIKACSRYTKFDHKLRMVDCDRYYELNNRTGTSKVTKIENKHKRTLARMNFELEQRKSLTVELSKLVKEKESKTSEIKKINSFLNDLQPKLNTILEATKPLQEYLKMNVDYDRSQIRVAKLLPKPLYMLYMQLKSYSEAFDKSLDIKVEGDITAAEAYELKCSHNMASLSDAISISDVEPSEILEKHPLSMSLTMKCGEELSLHITFNHMVHLNIVTTGCEVKLHNHLTTPNSAQDILDPRNLLNYLNGNSKDSGVLSPDRAVDLILENHHLEKFHHHVSQIGYAYIWVQIICGLQPTDPREPVVYLRESITSIMNRVKGRLQLIHELVNIEKKEIQSSLCPQMNQLRTLDSKIISWKRVNSVEMLMRSVDQENKDMIQKNKDFVFSCVIEHGKASIKYRECGDLLLLLLPSKLAVHIASIKHGDSLLDMVKHTHILVCTSIVTCVQSISSKRMFCYFFLRADYPHVSPFCLLSLDDLAIHRLSDNNNLMNLRMKVNVSYEENPLSNQIYQLIHSFHIMNTLESDVPKQNFKRKARGPNRSIPDSYNEQLNYFYHKKD